MEFGNNLTIIRLHSAQKPAGRPSAACFYSDTVASKVSYEIREQQTDALIKLLKPSHTPLLYTIGLDDKSQSSLQQRKQNLQTLRGLQEFVDESKGLGRRSQSIHVEPTKNKTFNRRARSIAVS